MSYLSDSGIFSCKFEEMLREEFTNLAIESQRGFKGNHSENDCKLCFLRLFFFGKLRVRVFMYMYKCISWPPLVDR